MACRGNSTALAIALCLVASFVSGQAVAGDGCTHDERLWPNEWPTCVWKDIEYQNVTYNTDVEEYDVHNRCSFAVMIKEDVVDGLDRKHVLGIGQGVQRSGLEDVRQIYYCTGKWW